MAMLGILILVSLIFLLSTYIINKKSKHTSKANLAPRVPGAWPLIGHMPALAPPNLPHIVLARLADKHGPIFTLKLGRHLVLVVSNSTLAKEIFTTHDMNVTFRPSSVAAKIIGYNYALFPIYPGGPYWQQMRKISMSELLSNRQLEQLKGIRIGEVKTSMKELYQTSRKSGTPVEMKQWLSVLNMNVLLRMVIGKKFSGATVVEDRIRFQKGISSVFRYLGLIVLRDIVPFLGWVDFGGHEKKMKKIAKEIDEFFEKWLQEHKSKRFSQENCTDEKDFMDALISSLDGKKIEDYDADTVCKATCLGMIGGYESPTAALTWAISLLLNNKHVMKKAQQELDIHIGTKRLVNDEDISKLVYLQAIVKESLRLYPPAIIPGPRQFVADCTIGGYHVPKGTWLMVNLRKIHTDPSQWPDDPMDFKPERFLTTHREVDVRGQHFELLPFGAGRRECPAKSYGIQMVQFTLATLLHAFDLSTPNGEPVDMTTGIGLTNMKVSDLEIIASPRLPSYCFE